MDLINVIKKKYVLKLKNEIVRKYSRKTVLFIKSSTHVAEYFLRKIIKRFNELTNIYGKRIQ